MTVPMRDPVSPDLRKTLRALKLGQMLATLPDRLTLAHQQKMAHADFLELVLADEVTRREAKSASLRARAAGLDPGMRLDTWDQSAAVRYDQQLWNELASLRFLDGPHGALILGPVGSGRHTWPARWDTSRSGAGAPCTWPRPASCSNGSKPPGSTTPSTTRCAASPQ
jgi:DNA replication protein DnaC